MLKHEQNCPYNATSEPLVAKILELTNKVGQVDQETKDTDHYSGKPGKTTASTANTTTTTIQTHTHTPPHIHTGPNHSITPANSHQGIFWTGKQPHGHCYQHTPSYSYLSLSLSLSLTHTHTHTHVPTQSTITLDCLIKFTAQNFPRRNRPRLGSMSLSLDLPYSWKQWGELSLVVWPKTKLKRYWRLKLLIIHHISNTTHQ